MLRDQSIGQQPARVPSPFGACLGILRHVLDTLVRRGR